MMIMMIMMIMITIMMMTIGDHGDDDDNNSSSNQVFMKVTWKSTPRVELRLDMKTPLVILEKIMMVISHFDDEDYNAYL